MSHLKLFLLALTFYTRIPSPIALDYQDLPQSTPYLPIVGWVVGAFVALCFLLANSLWSQPTAVIIAVSSGILLTGAFHEDGFADVCDGFGGGWGKQRILEIMKDSVIGVYGCLGLICIFSLKVSILSSMPPPMVALALLAGHSLSRLPPLLLMSAYDYARDANSKAAAAVYHPPRSALLFAAVCAVLPLLLLPPLCALSILPILLINYCLGGYFFRHIGGYTGDCLGASQQIAETIFYLSVSALWTFI